MCKSAQLEKFTRSEIYENRPDLVIIEDKVYSASSFRWAHPGGALFVSIFGGRDATLAFQSYHMREFPVEKMRNYCVGSLAETEAVVRPDKEHLELSEKVTKHLKKRTFAPSFQRWKALALFTAALCFEGLFLVKPTTRTFLNSAVLGLLFAWIGLNIQHDANHGAMFKTGALNQICGLAQAWIGGSQIMWLQEHVVLHHLHTGDPSMDPDAQLAPAMRGHFDAPWYPWMMFQKFYLLLAEAGYGIVPLFMAFFEVAAWAHKFEKKYKLSDLAFYPWGLQSLGMHCLFYVRFFVLPFLRTSDDWPVTLAKVTTTIVAGGFYLAFFFFLSHNFDGVNFENGGQPDGSVAYETGFLRQQVNSSSNVAGRILCFFNGGLNYQIEHHLFPRIAHSHYPSIAPIVRDFIRSNNLATYTHFPTVLDNLLSVFSYLDKTGGRSSVTKVA